MSSDGSERDGPGAGIRIGSVSHSALNFGSHGSATTTNSPPGSAGPGQDALLAAVRALRADLTRLEATRDARILDAELVATEEEITGSGGAGPGRLALLRDSLADAGQVAGALVSGVALAELLAALLGG
ncbi:hypothetical protein [Streptomyces uncialis]|uniref:hypothetical protein n=1 Tax=Streptomyces uncialis TaxID=1048205 RepID=UPI00386D120C|nr:hypothetical protein OG268_33745 [Streptomyces uncialis]